MTRTSNRRPVAIKGSNPVNSTYSRIHCFNYISSDRTLPGVLTWTEIVLALMSIAR